MLPVPARGSDSRLASKARAAAKASRADHRWAKAEMAAGRLRACTLAAAPLHKDHLDRRKKTKKKKNIEVTRKQNVYMCSYICMYCAERLYYLQQFRCKLSLNSEN